MVYPAHGRPPRARGPHLRRTRPRRSPVDRRRSRQAPRRPHRLRSRRLAPLLRPRRQAEARAPERLRRVRNITQNPRVAVLVDDYREDWRRLAYVLLEGDATMLPEGAEKDRALALLRAKYRQYRGGRLSSRCARRPRHSPASRGLARRVTRARCILRGQDPRCPSTPTVDQAQRRRQKRLCRLPSGKGTGGCAPSNQKRSRAGGANVSYTANFSLGDLDIGNQSGARPARRPASTSGRGAWPC